MRRLILTLAIILAFMGAGFAWTRGDAHRDTAFFAHALAEAHIPTTPNGPGAAYAQAMAARNPILGLAGTDLAALDTSLSELTASMQKLVDAQASEDDAEVVRNLYPIDFLRAMSELEHARRTFIASGSESDEVRYDAQLNTTLAEYTRALAAFTESFSRAIEGEEDVSIVGLSGVTNPPQMLALLSALEEGARRAHNEFERREKCLGGATRNCAQSDLALPHLPDPARISAATEIPPESADVEALRHEASGLDAPSVHVALADACIAGGALPHYLRVETAPDKDALMTRVLYVNDFFFLNTNETDAPVISYFRAQGVAHSLYGPLNYYICPQVGSVTGAAVAISMIGAFAREHPDVAPDARAALLHDVLREDAAVAYLREALVQLDSYDTEESAQIIDLAVMLRDKSAGFESLTSFIQHVTESGLNFKNNGIAFDPSPKHLFLTHSAFPSLFFAHNPLFGVTTPLYIQNDDAFKTFMARIHRYSELRESVPHDELVRDLRLFLKLERRI